MKQLILIGLLLCVLACQPHYQISAHSESIPVVQAGMPDNHIDSLIKPYQIELSQEMDEVIAYALQDFTKGRPNGSLNNWSASAVRTHQTKQFETKEPVMVLLNVGGLRNPINKGDVTVGDIYKLMPFDNDVVWVKLPSGTLAKIQAYLAESGGEPIAGATMNNGKLELDEGQLSESFWVITSDYLMNGGDRMDFFQDRIEFRYADILLRDLFIEVAKEQETLVYSDEERIKDK